MPREVLLTSLSRFHLIHPVYLEDLEYGLASDGSVITYNNGEN